MEQLSLVYKFVLDSVCRNTSPRAPSSVLTGPMSASGFDTTFSFRNTRHSMV